MPAKETPATRLAWLQGALRMSQKGMAASLGVIPSTYHVWLHNERGPSLDGALAIYRVHGVGPDFIYLGLPGNLPEQVRKAWEWRL